jgi:hypothetical protein
LFDFQLLSVDQTNIQYQDDIFSLEAAKNDGPVYIGIVGNVAYSSED